MASLSAVFCFYASVVPHILGLPSPPEQTPKLRAVLGGHTNSIMGMAFSPSGRVLATGGRDGAVVLWDVATGRQLRRLVDDRDPPDSIMLVAFSRDGKSLAAAGLHATVTVWEVATCRIRAKTGNAGCWIRDQLEFSPDGRTLARGGEGDIWYWDLARGLERRVKVASHHHRLSPDLAFAHTPRGKPLYANVAVEGHDDSIQLWDGASGKQIGIVKKPWYGRGHMAFSPDAKRLAAVRGREVRLVDLATGREVRFYLLDNAAPRYVRCVSFSPDGTMLAIGHADIGVNSGGRGGITLVDLATGRQLASWVAYAGSDIAEMGLAFSPDGRILASRRRIFDRNDRECHVKLWDVAVPARGVAKAPRQADR